MSNKYIKLGITLLFIMNLLQNIQAQNGNSNTTVPILDFDSLSYTLPNLDINPYSIIYENSPSDSDIVTSGLAGAGAGAGAGPGPSPIPTPSFPDRNVYWIHGLGGNEGSWDKPAKASHESDLTLDSAYRFPGWKARKLYSIIPKYGKEVFPDIKLSNLLTLQPPLVYDSINVNYPSTAGIFNAATMLQKSMAKGVHNFSHIANGDSAIDYIIAHSLGGIVSRAYMNLHYTNPSAFNVLNVPTADFKKPLVNGVVTFGSPHLGAKIVNSSTNPPGTNYSAITTFAGNGATALLAPIKATAAFFSSFVNAIPLLYTFNNQTLSLFENWFVDNATGKFLPKLFAPQATPVAQDIRLGSPVINTLYNFDSTSMYHKAVFYGVEEEPVIWRTFSSQFSKPEKQNLFMANNDQAVVDYVGDAQTFLGYGYNVMDAASIGFLAAHQLATSPAALLNPLTTALYIYEDACFENCLGDFTNQNGVLVCNISLYCQHKKAEYAKLQYQGAMDWLSDANDQWKVLIGAVKINYTQTGCAAIALESYSCGGDNGVVPIGSDLRPNVCTRLKSISQPGYFGNCAAIDFSHLNSNTINVIGAVNMYSTTLTYKESDGIVTAKSQIGFPGLKNRSSYYLPQQMPNTNHMQMRNCDETRKALKALYEGKMVNGNAVIDDHFKTDERP